MKKIFKNNNTTKTNLLEIKEYIVSKYKLDKLCNILNSLSILFLFIYSMFICFFIEALSRHSIVSSLLFIKNSYFVFLYNSLIIYLVFLLSYFFKRRIFIRYILTIFWLLLGLINGIVLLKRVTPFNAQDLKVLTDAATIFNKYFNIAQFILLVFLIFLLLFITILIFKFSPKYKKKINYIVSLLITVCSVPIFIFTTRLAYNNRIISSYFGNIAYAYKDYGLVYCFASSLFNTGIKKPESYNKDLINTIKNNSSLNEETNKSSNPNIIFVQLESFFDPTEVNFLNFNKDPIPNFRNLMENFSNGYFTAPSIGAGTSNTEFEILTGMSLRYFGPGEYPYKTILKENTCESIAFDLRNFGYNSHAIHNNGGNFYSRAKVFNNIGFDTFTSKEFMNVLEYTKKGWAKDNILLKSINDALNSTENTDYIFTITVEGHGDYPKEKVLDNPEITILGVDDEKLKNSWEYYCNLLYDVDKFIGDLINMINERNEKSIICFYGDHIPTMNLKPSDVKSRYLYNTNFAIWDNLNLKKEQKDLNAYQLTSYVLDRIGIHTGTVFNYHRNRIGTNDYQKDLELLQYDILYGKKYVYDKENLFDDTRMKMGILLPNISYVEKSEDKILIFGENFTNNSKVYINDETVTSHFVSDSLIIFDDKDYDLEDYSKIKICQVGSKNTVFASSNEYMYTNNL